MEDSHADTHRDIERSSVVSDTKEHVSTSPENPASLAENGKGANGFLSRRRRNVDAASNFLKRYGVETVGYIRSWMLSDRSH